jgi:hypothetical protein
MRNTRVCQNCAEEQAFVTICSKGQWHLLVLQSRDILPNRSHLSTSKGLSEFLLCCHSQAIAGPLSLKRGLDIKT